VFTRFPNGYPVLDITKEEAGKVIQLDHPNLPLHDEQYAHGRADWGGQDVGLVLYPLPTSSQRQLAMIKNDPFLFDSRREDVTNHYLSGWLKEDTGDTFVFDRSLQQLIPSPEAWLEEHKLINTSWQASNKPTAGTPAVTEAAAAPPPAEDLLPLALQASPVWYRQGDALPANPFVWHGKTPPFAVISAP